MDSEVCLPSGVRLSALRVKDLQKELSRRRLSCAGRKADLLARLSEYIIAYESGRNDTGDQFEGSAITLKENTILPEMGLKVFFGSNKVTEEQLTKKKTKKRQSHSRLNETFEYMEDEEDTTQAFTPEGKCVAPLVDATHRKSSHQAKNRRSKGDCGVTSANEEARVQTPTSSRKSRRSSAVDHLDFLIDKGAKQKHRTMSASSGFLTDDECDKQRHESENRRGKRDAQNATPAKEHIQEESKALYNVKSVSRQTRRKSSTARDTKMLEMAASTPGSVGRSRGGFAAQTVASAARMASRKGEALPVSDAAKTPTTKSTTITPQSSNIVSSKRIIGCKSKKDVLEGLPSTSRSIKKKEKGNATAHFARQHARLFAEMESILDQKQRIARKHEENMRAVPDAVKRLATPKTVRIPLHDANTGACAGKKTEYVFDASKAKTAVTETSFTFGKVEDFRPEQNQVNSNTVTTAFSLKTSKTRDERDVKSRTKTIGNQRKGAGFLGLTMPLNNPSLNLLATPKGTTPAQTRQKVSYTPRRGAIGAFVDTTKLSDREYEIALANGLIKPKSRTSTRLETSRKSRRDDILDVKRKLKI